ncbi:roadblock/LC7 domain-containing protein [Streptomyces sp. NPDC004609]|uniref:roadblock/LC7 domain-containing protein n=1 Tax=Streptomyces sp. NPDC004609 TaxID=3364704 RepID=UPI0036C63590
MSGTSLPDNERSSLDGLLEALITRSRGAIVRVLLATGDGLKLASAGATAQEADTMAALMSGLYSLSREAFRTAGPGGIRQILAEHDRGTLMVMSAGTAAANAAPNVLGTSLGVLTTPAADAGAVAYEMTALIRSLDEHLVTQARTEAASAQFRQEM